MSQGAWDLVESILSGRANEAWETRSARTRAVASTIFGAAATPSPALPSSWPSLPAAGFPALRALSRHRGRATATVRALIEALMAGRFRMLPELLHEDTWVLWPDGTLARHRRSELVSFLEGIPVRSPFRVALERVRSYSSGELRATLARGVPEALDSLSGARNGITVMASLETPVASLGRVMITTSIDSQGDWRAHNLPLPGVDDAHIAGAAPVQGDGDPASVADRIVRHLLLGHPTHLRALRGRMMKQVWIDGAFQPPEKLEGLAQAGPSRVDRAETVFFGTMEVPMSEVAASARSGAIDHMRRAALDAWGRSFDRLTPRAAATRVGSLDARTLRPTEAEGRVVSLLFRMGDGERGSPRWRLGAIWNEGGRAIS